MTRLASGEPVRVARPEPHALPASFTWRGQRHRVRRVEACHTVRRGGKLQRIVRLQTTAGVRCIFAQDLPRGSWQMRTLLSPNRSGGVPCA